jgi:type VI secretion system protein ImpM
VRVGELAWWGKLPIHGDFVRRNVSVAQLEDWQRWFERAPFTDLLRAGCGRPLPWSFVLSPGCLAFSGRDHVAGVIAASRDKVGRSHPFVISVVVPQRWLASQLAEPANALFWLARIVAPHVPPLAGDERAAPALETQLERVWRRRGMTRWPRFRRLPGAAERAALRTLAHACAADDDPARSLSGVPEPPWAEWPHCLWQAPGAWFWQQDDRGGFVSQHRLALAAEAHAHTDRRIT